MLCTARASCLSDRTAARLRRLAASRKSESDEVYSVVGLGDGVEVGSAGEEQRQQGIGKWGRAGRHGAQPSTVPAPTPSALAWCYMHGQSDPAACQAAARCTRPPGPPAPAPKSPRRAQPKAGEDQAAGRESRQALPSTPVRNCCTLCTSMTQGAVHREKPAEIRGARHTAMPM